MTFATQRQTPTQTKSEAATSPSPVRTANGPSGGFTGGTPGCSHGISGGISARDPHGPDTKVKPAGGVG